MKHPKICPAIHLSRRFYLAAPVMVLLCSVSILPVYSEESVQAKMETKQTDDDIGPKQFMLDLGRNSIRLFSTKNSAPFLFGAYASGLSRIADRSVSEYFESRNGLGNLEEVGTFLGGEYVLGPSTVALFVAGRLSDDPAFREMTYSMTQGIVLNTIITVTIKGSVNRMRPNRRNDNSFISGHTSSMFTIATVLNEFYGFKAGIPAYAVALFVGVTRLSKNAHFLSDVAAGAVVGYIVGKTVSKKESLAEQGFALSPTFSPQGDGLGLALTFRF